MPGRGARPSAGHRGGSTGSGWRATVSLVCATLAVTGCVGRLHLPGFVHPIEESSMVFESLGRSVRIDAYVPEGRGQRHPAAIVLHGSGGIHLLSGDASDRYAEALARRGIAAYVVHYFDATGTFIASISTEGREYWRWVRVVRDALDWVRTRPEVRPNRVGLFGVSMGAYLAVGAAATDPRITRMVLVAGGLEPGVADSTRRLPPTLLLHGIDDDEVTIAEEDDLLRLLARRRTRVVTHRYPGEGHNFTDAVAVDAVERAARFLGEGPAGTLLDVLRRSDTSVPPGDTSRRRIP